jgi:phage-related minor tail protein
MANRIVRAIEQVIIKLTIVEPLMKSFQSLFSGGINLSGLGFNPIAGATGSAHGNVFAGGRIIPFARGGVVDSPLIAPMALFGEAGPEAIVPLKRGADGNLGIAASGGGNWKPPAPANVVIHNYTGAQPTVSRNRNGDVTIMLKKALDGMVEDSISNGAGGRALKRDWGIKPFMGQ